MLEFKKVIIMITLFVAFLFTFRGVIIIANIQNDLSICQNKSLILEKFKESFISNFNELLHQPVDDLTSAIQGLAVTLLTAIIIAWAVAICFETLFHKSISHHIITFPVSWIINFRIIPRKPYTILFIKYISLC